MRPCPEAIGLPVAVAETVEMLRSQVDEVVCPETPDPFYAIGMHYDDFHQVPDEKIIQLMHEAALGASSKRGE